MIFIITLNLNELFIPLLVAIISSYTTIVIGSKPEKQKTSRLLYEESFLPIFNYVEKYLFSKSITVEEAHIFADRILWLLEESRGYYHPSVKDYALKLKRSTTDNHIEMWTYFSERFSFRYDKLCKEIGVPLRNSAYRLNQRQYKNWLGLFSLAFKLSYPLLIIIISQVQTSV